MAETAQAIASRRTTRNMAPPRKGIDPFQTTGPRRQSKPRQSVHLDVRSLYDLAPARELVGDQSRELVGRTGGRIDAELHESIAYLGQRHDANGFVMQTGHDRSRR